MKFPLPPALPAQGFRFPYPEERPWKLRKHRHPERPSYRPEIIMIRTLDGVVLPAVLKISIS
jgi:hypothetical protein